MFKLAITVENSGADISFSSKWLLQPVILQQIPHL